MLIQKAQELDDTKIGSELNLAKDNADVWLVKEQKTIIERIGKMFMGLDLVFEDIRSRNKFFIQTDSLKQYDINDVISRAQDHIIFLTNSISESEDKLADLTERINNIQDDVQNTSISAEERVARLSEELEDKKMEQENGQDV